MINSVNSNNIAFSRMVVLSQGDKTKNQLLLNTENIEYAKPNWNGNYVFHMAGGVTENAPKADGYEYHLSTEDIMKQLCPKGFSDLVVIQQGKEEMLVNPDNITSGNLDEQRNEFVIKMKSGSTVDAPHDYIPPLTAIEVADQINDQIAEKAKEAEEVEFGLTD